MAELSREEAIEDLTFLYEMDDYGSIHRESINFAIAEIKKVEKLENTIQAVKEAIKGILVCTTPKARPVKNTSKQAVYDAMYKIEQLVRRERE